MSVDVVSSVVTEAVSYDLVDLKTVKDELDLKESDATKDVFLARAISQASQAIQRYCNRVFVVETVQDLLHISQDPYPFQTPGGVSPLQLSRFPLALYAIVSTTADVESGTILPVTDTSALAELLSAAAPNLATGAAVAAFDDTTVTLNLPVTGVVPAGTTIAFGLTVVQTSALNTGKALFANLDYAADPAQGQLLRLDPFTGVATTWEALPVTAVYSAGHQEVPDDIVDAALRLITMRYFSRGRDPSLREQEMPNRGRQVWWVGGPPKSGGLPEEIVGLLAPHRVPVAL